MKVIYWTDPKTGNLCITSPVYGNRPDGVTEESFCESERLRVMPSGIPYRIGEHTECPNTRTFRDAWKDDGLTIAVDMTKARSIHMEEIRKVRNKELIARDVTFMRAVEGGDASAQSTIGAEKQALRDLPQTYDLEIARTPAQLKNKWPEGLPLPL